MNTNITILDGHLTKDPEMRTTPAGMSIAQLRIAVQRPRRDGHDQGADYVNVSVFGAAGENCGRYLAKGRRVLVEGRLRHHEWTTEEGQRREAVDVVARSVQFLSHKPDGDQSPAAGDLAPADDDSAAVQAAA